MKKNNLLFIVLIYFVLVFPIKSFTQNNSNNLDLNKDINKYWHYRDRLKYFKVDPLNPIFPEQGEGLIAGIRNTINFLQCPNAQCGDNMEFNTIAGATNMDFGEEAVYMGYYLGVLATEYKMLSEQNASYNETLLQIYNTLNAYIYEMDECEQDCYSLSQNSFDGFFVRSRIPRDPYYTNIGNYNINNPYYSLDNFMRINNHNEILNNNLNFGSNSPLTPNHYFSNSSSDGFCGLSPGQPGFIQSVTPSGEFGCEIESKEQSIGMLTGLALVAKCVPHGITVYNKDGSQITNFDLHDKAQEIAEKIVLYIAYGSDYNLNGENYGYCNSAGFYDWFIVDPSCNIHTSAYAFAYGYAEAAAAITGKDVSNYNRQNYEGWHAIVSAGCDKDTRWESSSLAAIGNSWDVSDIKFVSNGSIWPNRLWPAQLRNDCHDLNWDTFYVLLWAVLNDDNENYGNSYVQDVLSNALDQLNNAPCEGPYHYNHEYASSGWGTSYRWQSGYYQQAGESEDNMGVHSSFYGNYNGLDYMLLLNLYCIVTGHSSEFNARPLDGSAFPVYVPSFGYLGSAAYPDFVASANNIESTTQLYNHPVNEPSINIPAVGIYKAENSIVLNSGFKVEAGAYFHGYIEDVACYDIWNSTKINSNIYSSSNENDSTKITLNNKDSLRIFPNPSDGNMTVSYYLKESENGLFVIYSMMGEELKSYPLIGGINTFKISEEELSKGIYMYRAIVNNKQIASDKIVIIK